MGAPHPVYTIANCICKCIQIFFLEKTSRVPDYEKSIQRPRFFFLDDRMRKEEKVRRGSEFSNSDRPRDSPLSRASLRTSGKCMRRTHKRRNLSVSTKLNRRAVERKKKVSLTIAIGFPVRIGNFFPPPAYFRRWGVGKRII